MGAAITILVALFHLIAFSVIAFFIRKSEHVRAQPAATVGWLLAGGVIANLVVSLMLIELASAVFQAFGEPLADDFLVRCLPALLLTQLAFAPALLFSARKVLSLY